MYFPFLRARQFELIAAREFSAIQNQSQIIPIFEPVRDDASALIRGANILITNDNPYVAVLNSPFHKKKGALNLLDELEENLESPNLLIAGLHVSNDSYAIRGLVNHMTSNVMLICSDSVDAADPDFISLIEDERVEYILASDNRRLFRKTRDLKKKFIRWDDNFNKQFKNSDYLTIGEEKFTEENLYFKEDGNHGFCDFGPLSSQFVKGGSMPYAVAIHMTYQKENGEIWIRHFTSISNDDQANVQGKFAEAATKAVTFLDHQDIYTEASNELRSYVNSGKFPGLGMVKKISIKHHLELVNSLLS